MTENEQKQTKVCRVLLAGVLAELDALKAKIEEVLERMPSSGPETNKLHARATAAEMVIPGLTEQTNPPTPLEPPEGFLLGEDIISDVSAYTRNSILQSKREYRSTVSSTSITGSLNVESTVNGTLVGNGKPKKPRAHARGAKRKSWAMPKNLVRALQDDKGNTIYVPMYAAQVDGFEERFNKMWDQHPRKIGKEDAISAAAKLAPEEFDLLEENFKGWLARWRIMVQDGDQEYIPSFHNFIRRDNFREVAPPRNRDRDDRRDGRNRYDRRRQEPKPVPARVMTEEEIEEARIIAETDELPDSYYRRFGWKPKEEREAEIVAGNDPYKELRNLWGNDDNQDTEQE